MNDDTTRHGMQLPCPHCAEAIANISLDLDDLNTFRCRECDGEFSADDVREFMAKWSKVLKWVGTFPAE